MSRSKNPGTGAAEGFSPGAQQAEHVDLFVHRDAGVKTDLC